MSAKALFGVDHQALAEVMVEAGEPRWRGRQLAEAIYSQRVEEISSISTLSKGLREKLVKAGWEVGRPRIVQAFKSVDGTERYLVECMGAVSYTHLDVYKRQGQATLFADGLEEAGAHAAA